MCWARCAVTARYGSGWAASSPRPTYPLGATDAERRTPIITVNIWIFVDTDGSVTAAQLMSTNGSQVFVDAVINTVLTWKFGWREPQEKGRALTFPVNFKSPYFRPGASP